MLLKDIINTDAYTVFSAVLFQSQYPEVQFGFEISVYEGNGERTEWGRKGQGMPTIVSLP